MFHQRDHLKSGAILFPFATAWIDSAQGLILGDPVRILVAENIDQVPGVFEEVDKETQRGFYVAGFLCYEAGAAFELSTYPPVSDVPLAWFGVYPQSQVIVPPRTWMSGAIDCEMSVAISKTDRWPRTSMSGAISGFTLNISQEEYISVIARIKELIAAGDTYQVNYTCHARFSLETDPLEYFLALIRSHPTPYSAYINLGNSQFLSISPELFLRKRGNVIESRPMKGTRPRGRTNEEDDILARELRESEKDRAENVMILDMMRNDLGRFCEMGSVTVPEMYAVEKYRSVWQMTSTARGIVPAGVGIPEIIAATFPGSSVTGAPKKRTMEIIRDLEREPRGVYTGAIGLFQPNGDFTLNLAIRTLVHKDGEFDLGIGSGIVWDSDPRKEYEETLLKSQFAVSPTSEFSLFETLLLDNDRQYAFLDEHIRRLAASASYWDFAFDEEFFRRKMTEFAESVIDLPLRVHAELHQDGEISIDAIPLPPPPACPVRALISAHRTDSANRFLFHKTTERKLYDDALGKAREQGFFEVLFINERGNLTEGSITNMFARIGEQWVTPPISEGMLPGIWRESYIREMAAVEQPLTHDDLNPAEEVIIGNSVRGAIAIDEIVDEQSGRVVWRAVEP